NAFLDSKLQDIKLCLLDNCEYRSEHIDELLKKYNNIDYISSDINLGYGSGHNIAIEKYQDKTKYHVILNPDIYFDKNTIPQLFTEMEKNASVGLASTKIYYPNKKQQFVHKILPNPFDVAIRLLINQDFLPRFQLPKLFKKRMEKYELQNLDHSKNIICPVVSGCFMFFRNSLLKEIQGFDENFFMYFEDVDISRRAFKILKNVIFNNLIVYHIWDRGSYRDKTLLRYHIVSAFKYFNKWGWVFDFERNKTNNSARNV
ncbi:MAG: glycosyltransferase, partial [Legionellales bacterium]|nr:glycosyltransferase [Legionellales bacterium]